MKPLNRYLLVLCLICFSFISKAQENRETIDILADTVLLESQYDPSSPRIAFLYSALFPGLGQAYNRQYWKIPIVYGGFVGFGYMISFYNGRYATFRSELFQLLEDPSFIPPSGAGESQLRTLIDRSRRDRDYMIVLSAGFYLLQIVDAHVDAHLREFDLNPDLKVKLKPSFEPVLTSAALGVGLKIKF